MFTLRSGTCCTFTWPTLEHCRDSNESQTLICCAASSAEHNRKAIKDLIDRIPNSKDGILKYQVKWGAYDLGGPEVSGKILAWVKKKVWLLPLH